MKRVFAAIALIISSHAALAQVTELPPAAPGFHWQRVDEIKGAFLVPNGWHFKREAKAETLGYFASRENVDISGKFLVGLTVNVMPRLKRRDAVASAYELIEGFAAGKRLIRSWDASMGPFVGAGCLVQDETTVMHVLTVANPKTNTLYLFIFEAPSSEWEKAWTLGDKMMKRLLLDDEV